MKALDVYVKIKDSAQIRERVEIILGNKPIQEDFVWKVGLSFLDRKRWKPFFFFIKLMRRRACGAIWKECQVLSLVAMIFRPFCLIIIVHGIWDSAMQMKMASFQPLSRAAECSRG